MTRRTWLAIALLGSASVCGAAYDLAHTTPSNRFIALDGNVCYTVSFKDNGQQPTVQTVLQFIEIPLAQDTAPGRTAVATPIITALNNPDNTPATDPVLNALIAFKQLYFTHVEASNASQLIKNQVEFLWLQDALTIYNEQP